jgi:hypothetical protein
MKSVWFSSCLVSQDEARGLRFFLHRHVSWFLATASGCRSWGANAGCTKHIFGVGQVPVAWNSTATGLIRVCVRDQT